MRYSTLKDRLYRKEVSKREESRKTLRYVRWCCLLPGKRRYNANKRLDNLSGTPTKVVNRCVKTDVARSVYRDFKLSRQTLRESFLNGYIYGVKKGSW